MKVISKVMVYSWAVILVLSAVGCGKEKADVNAAVETLEAVGKARAKPTSSKSPVKSRVTLLSRRADAKWMSAWPAPGEDFAGSRPSPAEPRPIEIMGESCTMVDPSMNFAGPGGSMEFKIDGKTCPIEFILSTQFDQNGMKARTVFKALSEEARKLADVDSLEMNFSVSGNGDQKSGNLKIDLSAHSQKQGDVKMALEGDFEGTAQGDVSGELSGTLTLGEKEAELKQVIKIVNGKDQSEFYINGEKLTEDQMKRVKDAMSREQRD